MVEQEGSVFIQCRGSVLFLGSRCGRKRQEVGTELKEVKVGYTGGLNQVNVFIK
jgi:hypothetical protein